MVDSWTLSSSLHIIYSVTHNGVSLGGSHVQFTVHSVSIQLETEHIKFNGEETSIKVYEWQL